MVREIHWVGGDLPYPPLRSWVPLSIEQICRSWEETAARAPSEKLHFPGLYINLPDQVLADAGKSEAFGGVGHYLKCLEEEAEQIAVPSSFSLRTVYIGGGGEGVLSRFTSAQAESLFRMIHERFELKSCLQYSIELDLARTTPGLMAILREVGAHRVMAKAALPETAEQESRYRAALAAFVELSRRNRIRSIDVDIVCSDSLDGGAARRNLEFALGLGINSIHLERGRDPKAGRDLPKFPEDAWHQCCRILTERQAAAPSADDHENLHLYHAKGLHSSVIGLGFGAVSHARSAIRYLKAGNYISYLLALGKPGPPSFLGVLLRPSDEMRAFVVRNLENVGCVSCDDFSRIFAKPLERALRQELRLALSVGAVKKVGGKLIVPSSFGEHREVAAKFFYSRRQRRMFSA